MHRYGYMEGLLRTLYLSTSIAGRRCGGIESNIHPRLRRQVDSGLGGKGNVGQLTGHWAKAGGRGECSGMSGSGGLK